MLQWMQSGRRELDGGRHRARNNSVGIRIRKIKSVIFGQGYVAWETIAVRSSPPGPRHESTCLSLIISPRYKLQVILSVSVGDFFLTARKHVTNNKTTEQREENNGPGKWNIMHYIGDEKVKTDKKINDMMRVKSMMG